MRAKIYCKNKAYNGISAGVNFVDGVGETSVPHLVSWFKECGYIIENIYEAEDIPNLSYKELTDYAKYLGMNGIGYKKEQLIEKILELIGGKADDGGRIGTDETATGN